MKRFPSHFGCNGGRGVQDTRDYGQLNGRRENYRQILDTEGEEEEE